MRKLINWCRQQWILLSGCFLLAFIPLYPKLPLFDIVQTWVYVRFEDVAVGVVLFSLMFMLWRRHVFPDAPLTVPIFVYWAIGLVSVVVSIVFIGPTLSGYFPHLTLLHFARRIEYMGLFFLGYYALYKKPQLLRAVVWTLVVTVVCVVIYGVGQKFMGFPAFLTMNEEFAKGLPLRLPPTARIASTFGGHYDLGAYLVFVIPILGSLVFGMRQWWSKLLLLAVSVSAFVLLLFTASRISFIVYLLAISCMLWWSKKRLLIIPVIILSFVMLNFVSSASERFYKTFRFSDVIVDISTGQPIGTLDELEGNKAIVEQQESPAIENLPKGSGFIGVGGEGGAPTKTVKTIEYITSSALATGSGEIATISGSFLIQKAFVYDISLTTRFQGQWPKAIEAFKRNIVLGSGFSTLGVASDGDYMRMLGETGVAGTIAFLGIFLAAFFVFFTYARKLPVLEKSFVTGVFAGLVGLLLNGILIDVFEASKVAFSFWLILGVAMAVIGSHAKVSLDYKKLMWKAATHPLSYLVYIFVGIWVIHGVTVLGLYFIGDDFTWLKWAASPPNSITTYFVDSTGFFYRPVAKMLYQALYAVFWLKPEAYHIVSLLLYFWIAASIFLIALARRIRVWIALGIVFVFVTLSIHHEIVYWISTYSHALSAGFALTSLLFLHYAWVGSGVRRFILRMFGLVGLLLASLSYEGGAAMPVVAVLFGFGLYKQSVFKLLDLAIVLPVYLGMRSFADALPPGGDYSVRGATFVINTIANLVGYVFSIFFGPNVLEFFGSARAQLRSHVLAMSIVGGVFMVGCAVWFVKVRSALKAYKSSLWFLVMGLVSALPFWGLGGIAERYALLPSAFMILSLGEFLEVFLSRRSGKIGAVLCTIFILLGLGLWNWHAGNALRKQWLLASDVTKTTVLAMKANYFPLQDKQAFVFVNTPIRFGRAWIFPTGLDDALWHIFKFNGHDYKIYKATNLKEAFAASSPLGEPVVLVFDDFVLNVAKREYKPVEDTAP